MASELTFRDGRLEDVPRLAALLTQLGYPASGEAVGVRVERLRATDGARLVVAQCDGSVVGFASLHVAQTLEYDEPAARVSAGGSRSGSDGAPPTSATTL